MRLSIRFAVFAGLAALAPVSAQAQQLWQSSGPPGGIVTAIAPAPSDAHFVYAGIQDGGIFRSQDGGATWSAANAGLSDLSVAGIAVSPADARRVLAGTNGGGFLSVDGASSWSAIPTLSGSSVSVLRFDPLSSQTVYAVGIAGTLAKSTDGGSTWTPLAPSIAALQPRALAIDPTEPATLYLGTQDDGVYKSQDGGASWTVRNTGLTNLHIGALVVDPTAPATVYAGTLNDGAFRSQDGASNWEFFGGGITGDDVSELTADPSGAIYLGNRSGMYQLVLGGLAWSRFGPDIRYINALAVGPGTPGRLFVGSGLLPFSQGILAYSDDGSNFTVGDGIHGVIVVAVAADPFAAGHVLAACTGGSWVSDDGGTSWNVSTVPAGLPTTVVFDPDHSGVVYVAGGGIAGSSGGIVKSIDGGDTWTGASAGLPAAVVRALLPVPGTAAVVVAGAANGAYRSVDGGGNWQAAAGLSATVWALASDPSGAVWAGASDGVYKSNDQGASWTPAGDLNELVRTVLASSATARVFGGTDTGLLRSDDGGVTWVPVSGGFPSGVAVRALVEDADAGVIFAGTLAGVYESHDSGSTWTPAGQGLSNPFVLALTLTPNGDLFAGTDAGGVFRLSAPAEPAVRDEVVVVPPRGGTRTLPPKT